MRRSLARCIGVENDLASQIGHAHITVRLSAGSAYAITANDPQIVE